ncbi:CBS domain-containing protein [Oxalobacteraceae bacterium OM1]|nr:CBS domain-containing protein [Oxalobacteraceae bacterium OM1]
MKVADVMTRDVRLASPDQSIMEAARMMAECDAGALPVGDNDRLVGMVTDRDIVVRALPQGRTDARIRDVMTPQIKYCYEDDDINDIAHNMGDEQIRRLAVLDRQKSLVGIISLGDIANQQQQAADALAHISQPAAQPSQRPH